MSYELVAGFETHIELATKTKIFCGCTTKFGGAPNSHCCPVCIGLPGTLPKLNREVVRYAIRAGLAVHGEIAEISKMDRKNYCYPDLSKAYQISQLYAPLIIGGYVELSNGRKIRLHHIHIEEDAGKLISTATHMLIITVAVFLLSKSFQSLTFVQLTRRESMLKSFSRLCVTSEFPTVRCRKAQCVAM